MESRIFLALAVLAPSLAAAQSLRGRIIDATDSAVVSGAAVSVEGRGRQRTNGRGEFVFNELGTGQLQVSIRMLGYAPHSDTVTLGAGQSLTRDFHLTRIPRLLTQMTVKGRSLRVPAGFEDVYRRAQSANGALVTREQIDSINPRDVVGLLNMTGPVRASANPRMPDRLQTSRCRSSFPGAPSGAQPVRVFLNGAPIQNSIALDEILDHMAPSTIQAIEMYNGPTSVPPTFQPACGVLAIWTRRG